MNIFSRRTLLASLAAMPLGAVRPFRIRGDETADDKNELLQARRPERPYRVWFQPRLFDRDIDLYKHMTFDASGWLDPRLAEAMGNWTTSWEGALLRCQSFADAGLTDRTIFCFGHITPGAQRNGQPLATDWLRERAEELKAKYPEMPGVAFFQRGEDDSEQFRELVRFCDALSGELWPDAEGA